MAWGCDWTGSGMSVTSAAYTYVRFILPYIMYYAQVMPNLLGPPGARSGGYYMQHSFWPGIVYGSHIQSAFLIPYHLL